MEAATHRRDILIEPFRKFVAAQAIRLHGQRNRLHEFAGLPILLTIVEEEVLQRHVTSRVSFAEMQPGAERDQSWRAVSNRGAIGDVAADGCGVADLDRTIAPDHFGKARMRVRHERPKLGEAGHCADPDGLSIRSNPAQIIALAQKRNRG